MELIGLMDSPFVRRVAVTAHLYGIHLKRRPLSVYRHAHELSAVNPLMTAPALILNDGRTFIDSGCICEYFDDLLPHREISLMPFDREARANVKQIVAHANMTCEKTGQLYREWSLRSTELRCQVTIERMRSQIDAGLNWLEQSLSGDHYVDDRLTHADIMSAITLTFVKFYAASLELKIAPCPRLARLTLRLESQSAFVANPLE